MQALNDIWQYLIAAIGAIFWFARLESRVTWLQTQRHEDLKATAQSRAETNAILTELRNDIKTLLRESGK